MITIPLYLQTSEHRLATAAAPWIGDSDEAWMWCANLAFCLTVYGVEIGEAAMVKRAVARRAIGDQEARGMGEAILKAWEDSK